MSYFEDQMDTWFDGGIFWYAEENGVNLEKILKRSHGKKDEWFAREIYRQLDLEYGAIPGDFDPYVYLAEKYD